MNDVLPVITLDEILTGEIMPEEDRLRLRTEDDAMSRAFADAASLSRAERRATESAKQQAEADETRRLHAETMSALEEMRQMMAEMKKPIATPKKQAPEIPTKVVK